MIAVETNVLVYAHRSDSPFHAAASRAVRELAEGPRSWAIPWPRVHEFYAIVTHPKDYSPPSTLQEAIDQLRAWAESPRLSMIGEMPDHLDRLAGLLESGRIVGPKVHDARIAAICLAHGVEHLLKMDRDFSRFPQLQTRGLKTAP
jgi:uncharacterized protein